MISSFTNVILIIVLKYSYPFESIFYHCIRIADAIYSAREFKQFYNGEQIPLPCFGSPELLDECGGEFACVAAAVEVAEFYDNFMKTYMIVMRHLLY